MWIFYLYQYWVACMILISQIKARWPSSAHLSCDAIITPYDFWIMWIASAARKYILYGCLLISLFVCVCVLWPCASLGLCLLQTVILSNGLSLSADVLSSAPQLHPTCFHAVRQCSSLKRSSSVGGGSGGRFLLRTTALLLSSLTSRILQ